MSVSLSEERDRIQRQVEELEQSLSVTHTELELLSCETGDESGSDDTEDESAGGLLAQREKIQQEIQNLESMLGPQSPVCETDEDDVSSDESELGLSVSVDSCLQVNLVYQQVVQETLDQLETLLAHNQRQQRELVSQLSGPIKESSREQPAPSSYQQPITMYLGHFLKPYFKDKLTGLGPPANQETKEKASRMTGCLDNNKLKLKRWESWQKTLLVHSVSRDSLRRLIQPKLSRVDYLSQKLSSAGETHRQQLREQIDGLERDIDQLRGKKEEELIGDRYEEHDWARISNIDFEGTKDAEDIRSFWQNFLHPSIKKSGWSQEEMQRLGEISRRHGQRHWDIIAQELGTGRTAFMCIQTFQRFVSDSLRHSSWTSAEDVLLRELVDKMRIGNFIPYTQISYFMEGRDPAQLVYRWNQVLDPSLKKGLWTKEEDQLLLRAVSRHGEKNWWRIRLEVPGRTDTACRDRYHDCLKAGTKRGPFDQQEEELLLQLVQKHGVGRWAKIAAEIPHRYDAQCLRAWRKLSRLRPPRKHNELKKAKEGRKTKRRLERVKEESSKEESSEEEMVVEYMDSDEEEKKNVEEKEEEEEEEQFKEFTIPPMQEWIPADGAKPCSFLSYSLVALPPSAGGPGKKPVRSTVVGRFGCSVIIGPSPRVLAQEERHGSSTMMMVTADQLQAFLSYQVRRFRHKGKDQTGTRPPPNGLMNSELDCKLQAAVAPWIGNLLIPAKTRLMAADTLREKGEMTQLPSTSVFFLLLQAMNVDSAGCKEIIEQRRCSALSLTPPTDTCLTNRRNLKTKAAKLQLDKHQELVLNQLCLLQDKRRNPPPLHPPITGGVLQIPPNVCPPISDVSFPQSVFSCHTVPPPQRHSAPRQQANQHTAPSTFTSPAIIVVVEEGVGKALLDTKAKTRTTTEILHPPLTAAIAGTPASTESPLSANLIPAPATSISPNQHSDHDYSMIPSHFAPTQPKAASKQPNSTPKHQNPASKHLNLSSKQPKVAPKQKNPVHLPSVPNDSPKEQPRRKRGREEEGQDTVKSSQDDVVGGTGGSVGGASTNTQEGKRVRKLSQKARALQEEAEAKAEARRKKKERTTSSPCKKRPFVPCPKQEVMVQQDSQLSGLQLLPGQSMWVVTSGGLAQLAQTVPQSLQLALVPGSSCPSRPVNVISQPSATPPLQLVSTGQQTSAKRHIARSVPVKIQPRPPLIPPMSKACPPTLVLQPVPNPRPLSSPIPSCLTQPPPELLLPYEAAIQGYPLRREALQFDSSLMFQEPQSMVCDWLSGQNGVSIPGLGVALPYLPPFVSNLSTLRVLLRAKKSLIRSSVQLLSRDFKPQPPTAQPGPDTGTDKTSGAPPDLPDSTSDPRSSGTQSAPSVTEAPQEEKEEELVAAVRQMVAERFSGNPAYQLLKARFLSCFTVPALLATIQPITKKTTKLPHPQEEEREEDEEEAELKKIKEQGRKRRAERALLLSDRTGPPASHFTGIPTRPDR
ncbi:snRNA-activating protein complex subunit 4 [Echeneis naucrates]|uniref:snRNA-activating protein complex subunit 4 n=1 Tax=Echeneis naucrates TaxID=173247 RepID=UPI0011139C78|nr:snRNA-activating protein complex subunit 4 [Echeneis naucrates]